MKRLTAPWTTALATAALLALPVAGGAQTPQPPPDPQPERSTTLSTPANQDQANQNESPAEHLRQAKDALAKMDANSVPARAKSQIAALRRHINNLERAAAANDSASPTGEARRSPKATTGARGKVNWGNEVAAIDRIITELAGTGSASMTGTTDPGTAGTSGSQRGTKGSASAALDDTARNQLLEVRTHITACAAAMSGTASSPSTATGSAAHSSTTGTTQPTAPSTEPAPASSPSSTPSATPAPAPETETQPETQTQAGSSAGTTGQTGTVTDQSPSTMTGQAKVDAEAAKQHLTAARDTLTQITQLPAAAQLQGEARTQVSQLIQNFNELITTQSNWRETYEKLEANLNALIGPAQVSPDASATTPPAATPQAEPANRPANPPANPPADPPAQPGTQGTQGTQATPGAVGTSGTATLDAGIRQKLVEFRQHLVAFHAAAGGEVK